MLDLVGVAPQLGQYIDYSIDLEDRLDFIRNYMPHGIEFQRLSRIFKNDLLIDCIVECLHDSYLYYAHTTEGRGDELYYFRTQSRLFHGEKIWSTYHPFVNNLRYLEPSACISEPCWFVGSRNNYTHQLVDFIPNLLYRINLGSSAPSVYANVFGSNNPILASLLEVPAINQGWHQQKVFLNSTGVSTRIGGWNVRCVHFKRLYLVRHMSIFRAFHLLRSFFSELRSEALSKKQYDYTREAKDILFLSRRDNRVVNQAEIEAHLTSRWGVEIVKDLHEDSFAAKIGKLSGSGLIVVPPGSDNINAFCFADDSASFCQLIATPCSEMLQSPFTSYAGLRYILPYLNRTVFIESKSTAAASSVYSGIWSAEAIDLIFQTLLG